MRLAGVANAAPILFGHLYGGHSLPKFYLLQFLVRLLLVADVLANHRLILHPPDSAASPS